MRLIKIDPQTKTIEPINMAGGLDAFREVIGCRFIDVCARQNNLDALVVDDESLDLDPQPAAFKFNGFGPVHGIAIVSGADEEGETKEPTMTLDEVRQAVTWLGEIHTEPFIDVICFADFTGVKSTLIL